MFKSPRQLWIEKNHQKIFKKQKKTLQIMHLEPLKQIDLNILIYFLNK